MIAAHRYCLGRRSYIVSSCIDWLQACWPLAEQGTRRVILRDTAEAFHDETAGSEMDAKLWKRFLAFGVQQLSHQEQDTLIQTIEHSGREWPNLIP